MSHWTETYAYAMVRFLQFKLGSRNDVAMATGLSHTKISQVLVGGYNNSFDTMEKLETAVRKIKEKETKHDR